uniref:NADH dehydrogenase subunit 1 n=1 Tax=Parasteatoda cingulata TaxID=2905676 RepID=UPI0022381C49|nr:NADH dehydrogenase subunit 1 [Parasteatoda cingulata]UYG23925.1 NADH dehydrogenase subunit 1 [Parasteatoda cingulata]
MNSIIPMICLLVSVAFYTILERKILGYIQIRKGPNKVGFMGILQPFSDAIKLFNKNLLSSEFMNFSLSYITPALSLILALLIMSFMPMYLYSSFDNKHNILLFFIISSLSVYSILSIGWSSNSKYSHMGAIRSVAQMISYEVSFFLIILFFAILSNSYYFYYISISQNHMWFFWGNLMLFFLWFTSCLAEVNRSPFDFAEGESELVSGFNVEYMGGWFALIFLAEYSSMIILCLITMILFFNSINNMISMPILIIITILMLWVRGSYPRFRYDMLMYLSWKIFLTITLFMIPLSLFI